MTVHPRRVALVLAGFLASPLACGSSPPRGVAAPPSAARPEAGASGPAGEGGAGGGAVSDGGANPGAETGPATPTGPTEFASSFEPSDPQPTWTSAVELDPRGEPRTAGITGSATGPGGSGAVTGVTASGENPPAETAAAMADGDVSTKWLIFATTGWVRLTHAQPIAIKRYALTSADDAPERDPKDWILEGSADAQSWTVIDTRSNQSFAGRLATRAFELTNATAFRHHRLTVTRNGGAPSLQIAELQLSTGETAPAADAPMTSAVGKGPAGSWNAKPSAGFSGLHALRYAGRVTATGRGHATNKIFAVDLLVTPASELSYVIFPDDPGGPANEPGSHAAIDLAFDDGSYLSELGAVDEQFAKLSPAGQGGSRTLYPREWNHKRSRIGEIAAGKTIKRILIGYDHPAGPTSFSGWIDDVRITARAPEAPAHLSDYVLTTRGTNSGGGYSRGNNLPATAVPHGFNFWTPVTDAGSTSWLYTYHRSNNADNLPTLQALSLSHEPSPWMGDRQSFQVMPSAASAAPNPARPVRALAFRHENEIARAHHYRVRFENGIEAEIAPTDHAAIFRFRFPGVDASLIFDNIGEGGLTLDRARGELGAYSDAGSGLSAGATRIFIHAAFDKPITAGGPLTGGGPNVTGYFRFDPGADRTVTMRIATSLISVEQARKNLALEIAATDTFESVQARAQKAWDDKLGIIKVEGANFDQLTTLYSNLYRLFLYPNSGFENTGSAQAPVFQYASPVSPPAGAGSATRTGARIVDGKIYVNNGFWDTYRSTWPAYTLLTPTAAGEMIDGFVQHHRDGGWIARWSSPGYADLMTGTSSDVAFADAYVKGVRNFDAQAAYDAALRNATSLPPSGAVGRKGLATSIFRGYSSETDAGLSWALAGCLNDFGIANFAAALAGAPGPRQREYSESAEYFRNRALNYVNHFDPAVGFFQGRSPAGWRSPPGSYDPRIWGHDYTETNGWNMAFDAPHDGQGLANLYGGKDKLAAKLDQFFATPETATFPGSYGGVIHEMREARDVRMGQLGLSNQPAYHIIYMYDFVGQPWKTQAKVRDALARLFVGSAIGQGYLGDEDNGALSAWQIFSALGFYPLQVGSPSYAIGSPLFRKATVALENGKRLVINAPNNGPANVYIQRLTVNGQPYGKTHLPHALLAEGATLDFEMGPAPSIWGTGAEDAPPSITTDAQIPRPLHDAATGARGIASSSDGTDVKALFDDTSTTRVSFSGGNPSISYRFSAGAPRVTFYTLTSGATAADPTGFSLHGSTDGTTFTRLDQRTGERFAWRAQTRAFKVATPGAYAHYRLDLIGAAPNLGEVELLVSGADDP